jgi:glycine cleavage system H protein
MKVIKDLYYSDDHEWVKLEGDEPYIDITDFAQHQLGDIVYVELPEIDDELEKEDSFSALESVKAASDAYIPVDGKVIEINEDLLDSPELLNSDPYDSWIIKVELTDKSQLDGLMSSEEYEEYIAKEV